MTEVVNFRLDGSSADAKKSVNFGDYRHIRFSVDGAADEVRMTNDEGINANISRYKLSVWPIDIQPASLIIRHAIMNFDSLNDVMFFTRDKNAANVTMLMWGEMNAQ